MGLINLPSHLSYAWIHSAASAGGDGSGRSRKRLPVAAALADHDDLLAAVQIDGWTVTGRPRTLVCSCEVVHLLERSQHGLIVFEEHLVTRLCVPEGRFASRVAMPR